MVWSGLVRAHLSLRDIFPDELLPPPYLHEVHARADRTLHSLLAIYAGPAHTRMIQQFRSGKEAWVALTAIHTKSQALRLTLHNDQLATLAKGENESIMDYVQRAQQLQADLAEAGQPTADMHVISAIMRGLPDGYEVECALLRSLSAYQPLTFAGVIARLQERELDPRRGIINGTSNGHGNGVSHGHGSNGGSNASGSDGVPATALFARRQHNGRGGKRNNGNRSGNSYGLCHYCQESGHYERECKAKQAAVERFKTRRAHETASFAMVTDL